MWGRKRQTRILDFLFKIEKKRETVTEFVIINLN